MTWGGVHNADQSARGREQVLHVGLAVIDVALYGGSDDVFAVGRVEEAVQRH